MSQYDRLDGIYYIYAEYCPGPFYMGWWLYAAPLTKEKYPGIADREEWPDREHSVWLNFNWRLDALMKAIGLPELRDYRGGNHTKYTHGFLEKCPQGILCRASDGGRYFEVMECAALWDYSRMVRELQWLSLKEEGFEYAKEEGKG